MRVSSYSDQRRRRRCSAALGEGAARCRRQY
jgi:hypothetical protein